MTWLQAGPLSAKLRPAEGGRIAALRHRDLGDLIVPMTDAPFDPEHWQKAGAYPLIPFHNRIPSGRLLWRKQTIQLPLHPAEPNALHGFTSRRGWSLTGTGTGTRAVMTLDHQGDTDWPWDMHAEQVVELSDTALTLHLSVANRSKRTMPAGLGWHPFIAAQTIEADAQTGWPLGSNMLPLGHATHGPVPGPTRCLSDWSRVKITLASGARLEMTSSEPLSHLVIHEGEGHACIEPASHLAGAPETLHPLDPGETLTAAVTLALL